jgi:GAF domain-containing protein
VYRADRISAHDKTVFYEQLNSLLNSLIENENDWLANLANAAGLLFDQMEDINWAGFYLLKDNELVLGPYQGKPACTRIPMGKGVCGTAATQARTIVVEDVHRFPGHIACDAQSKSEIVLPMFINQDMVGVLDIDSPVLNRFDQSDALGLEGFLDLLQKRLHKLRG